MMMIIINYSGGPHISAAIWPCICLFDDGMTLHRLLLNDNRQRFETETVLVIRVHSRIVEANLSSRYTDYVT